MKNFVIIGLLALIVILLLTRNVSFMESACPPGWEQNGTICSGPCPPNSTPSGPAQCMGRGLFGRPMYLPRQQVQAKIAPPPQMPINEMQMKMDAEKMANEMRMKMDAEKMNQSLPPPPMQCKTLPADCPFGTIPNAGMCEAPARAVGAPPFRPCPPGYSRPGPFGPCMAPPQKFPQPMKTVC